MTKDEFENFKKSKTPEAEAISFLEKEISDKLSGVVKNICAVVIDKYDREISESKNKIESLKKEVAQLDVVLWNESAT